MNIFLIDPDASISGRKLYAGDPLRANKQIVECAQLLAFFEIKHTGRTTLLAASGMPYRATKAQLNHPIAMHMYWHSAAYKLCWDTLAGLLQQHPDHACGRSLIGYGSKASMATCDNEEYVVCRRGERIVFAKSRIQYADYMLQYMINAKGFSRG